MKSELECLFLQWLLILSSSCHLAMGQIPDAQTKAFQTIQQITDSHPNDLPFILQNDDSIRMNYTKAHLLLTTFQTNTELQETFNFYKYFLNSHPQYFTRSIVYDKSKESAMVWIRERIYQTFINLEPLTVDRKNEISLATKLTGRYQDIWDDFSVFLLDNANLDGSQKDFIYDLLRSVPKDIHNLRSISIIEYFGKAPPEFSTWGPLWNPWIINAVNIFGTNIGIYSENEFPGDVPPRYLCLFCGALVHEVNHIVDAYFVSSSQDLRNREYDLIKRAGSNHMNYLRSMLPDGFFASAPQEFFASISNQWFCDSGLTLKLALVRFDKGYKEPLNQYLFFAEVYSKKGSSTLFYTIDTEGYLLRREAPVLRDKNGRIIAIIDNRIIYNFILDEQGNVISYTTRVNKPPEAYIDSILPNPAYNGQTIYFSGHGSDPDGSISGYEWRSSIDGFLSNSSSFNTSSLSIGTYTIYFRVQDNAGLWSQEVTAALTVQAKASSSISISVNPSIIEYGIEDIRINGSILPVHGGVTVVLALTGPDGSTDSLTIPTDGSGFYSVQRSFYSIGTWKVQASWSGDTDHTGVTSSILTFTVTKRTTILLLIIDNSQIKVGNVTRITIKLVDSKGAAVQFAFFSIDFPDGRRQENTDSAGTFSFDYAPRAHAGDYTITVEYEGDQIFGASTARKSLTILRLGTTLNLAFKSPVFQGEAFTVSAMLVDERGNPLGNEKISFDMPDYYPSFTTDSSGIATFSYKYDTIGTYTITASFDGAIDYSPSTTSQTLTVQFNYMPILIVLVVVGVGAGSYYWYWSYRRKLKPSPSS